MSPRRFGYGARSALHEVCLICGKVGTASPAVLYLAGPGLLYGRQGVSLRRVPC